MSFFLPSVSVALFIAIFFNICFSVGSQLLIDADTGHQIRVGEYILAHHSVPRSDIFSFISPPLPWTIHGWLSEVMMAVVHGKFGLTGLVIAFAAFIALIHVIQFRILRAQSNNVILAIVATLFVVATSRIHWLARPHVVSFLFFIVWYFLLDSYQAGISNSLRTLPLLMFVWVNFHGGFILGFVLLGIFILGNFIHSIAAQGEDRAIARNKAKSLLSAAALCLIVSLINPSGYHILLFPFKLISDQYVMDHVMEFLSPNFHNTEFLMFKIDLLLMIILFGVSRKKLSTIEMLLTLLFTNMSLSSARHIPLFGFVMAPILMRQAQSALNEKGGRVADFIHRKSESIARMDLAAAGHVWVAVTILAVVWCAAKGEIHFAFDPKIKPVEAVEFLKREPIRGNMFDNDEFGDYVIYAAWPQYKVFIDGRLDMYGAGRMKEFSKIQGFDQGWDKVIDKYRISWIFDDSKSLLCRYLLKDSSWRLIYADTVADIFVRDSPEYRYLVDKYWDVKPILKEDTGD